MPSRRMLWSSASSMRTFSIFSVSIHGRERQLHLQSGSQTGLGFDLERPAQMAHALFHAKQSHAPNAGGVEAGAVILDAEQDLARLAMHPHRDCAGLGVPGAIVQSFL